MKIEPLPEIIEVNKKWTISCWAGAIGVSDDCIIQAVNAVGPKATKVKELINKGYRIAICDDNGVAHLVAKIFPMRDGVAISAPYGTHKNGWLFDTPVRYDKQEYFVPLDAGRHFTVSSTVKLSMHMDGFVQFSSSDGNRILSGYSSDLGIKGLGLRARGPIRISSGPLFGVVFQGLSDFAGLNNEPAMIFEKSDLWLHPKFLSINDSAYNLEVFMFPRKILESAFAIGNKRVIDYYLPFNSPIVFPFRLRVIEVPNQPFFLGLILSRISADTTIASGYKLGSPALRGIDGQMRSIGAWYPCPEFVEKLNPTSLDYRPLSQAENM